MADEKLRELERRWRASGETADEVAYLRERVRQGQLDSSQLSLAAYLGLPAARALFEEDDCPVLDDAERLETLRARLAELIPEVAPTPLEGGALWAHIEAEEPRTPHRLLLLVSRVGVGDYGAGVTLTPPAPDLEREGVWRFGRAEERELLCERDGSVRARREGERSTALLADDPLRWFERHLRACDPAHVPWHLANAPRGEDPAAWSARTRAWCEQVARDDDYSLRTHLRCPLCRFGFLYRTSNYSLSSSADVQNWATCANPDCRHDWTEWS